MSVVIPAYNEQDRIGPTLQHTAEYLEAQSYTWEMLVVSDGSSDETAAVAEQFAANRPEVRVIAYEPNRGKGYAVRTGMLAASGERRASR